MRMNFKVSVLLLLGCFFVTTPLPGQPQPDEDLIVGRLEAIEERLTEIETLLASLVASNPEDVQLSNESRMERLEQRVARLESGAGPLGRRPGMGSTTTAALESRLRALEREVARLKR